MLDALFVIAIIALCGLVVLIVLDLLRRGKSKKQPTSAPVAENDAPAQPAATVVAQAETQEEPAEDSADSVSFAVATKTATLEEKYLDLTPQYKSYYDQIVQYAMRKDGAKRIKNANYEEYKLYHARLVRLQVKGGVVVCQFILVNSDFQSYIYDNKVKVKQSPIVLKVTDDETLQAAKNSIDIAYDSAMRERDRKMQLRREKIKQAREAKKNGESE